MSTKRWGSLLPARAERARPFLKWAGGKGQVFPRLRQHFLSLVGQGVYFEPFLGGGAVFFSLRPDRAVLSDVNPAVIAAFSAVKNNENEVLRRLGAASPPRSEREYRALRDRFNDLLPGCNQLDSHSRADFAATFIRLNHTCFNGLYRVNKQGRFNVPYGFYENPFIYSSDVIRADGRLLRAARTKLTVGDYERVLSDAGRGDLAYLDPPYDPVSETSRFTGYTASGFGASEQERLARVVADLVDRGCRVVLSNSPSPLVVNLYKGYHTERIRVPRAINSVGSGRAAVDELVVLA